LEAKYQKLNNYIISANPIHSVISPLRLRQNHYLNNGMTMITYLRTLIDKIHFLRNSILFFGIFLTALPGCYSDSEDQQLPTTQSDILSLTPMPPPQTMVPSSPTPETPASPYLTWVDPNYPSSFYTLVAVSNEFELTSDPLDAEIRFSPENGTFGGTWIYVPAAPYPSPLENLESSSLMTHWLHGSASSLKGYRIALSQDTKNALSILWGEPDPDTVFVVDPDSLLETTWSDPELFALLPFEELNPFWKLLSLDNQTPLLPDFKAAHYALSLPVYFNTTNIPDAFKIEEPLSNFYQSSLTTIALTGVTALVRDTAAIMEEKGVLYPAVDIRDLLESADITHISNEVPFAEDCPTPDPNQQSLYFCSKDEYIRLLESVGTDIVELSGDHFGDWGPEAMLHSLDLYHDRDWLTYGGGETLTAGLKPVFIEHNGNKFAFIGCNGKVHDSYATASDTNPGASRCDFEWMQAEISQLAKEGYLVIATMQHEEVDSFSSIAIQQWDFRHLAESGAVIVSGSQAHHPQAIEVTGTSFIHYGLGNLFFDQWYLAHYNPSDHINKDKAFIDIHSFYNGSHINTQLITLQFIDNARPRLMSSEERATFLENVYEESLWDITEK